ncbi:uncharacterized protein LOC129766817 [Toxorhynchites rutilus septentrionalis]|uniref:uncharacterized protein LOC129766817 n=2 Tax=Toxorhynchites rutilus septentrionalis TaxID=329112 RepID=UPI00247A748A|nr:uncharacterized protein LOC129766817 [Toxorhynchites rutilus septentrionalis]
MNTLTSYGMTLDQVFSMVVDNGANMLAAVRKLKEELVMLSLREDDDSEENFESNDTLTASLCEVFRERLNLIRCAAHTLQLAVLDVVNKSNDSIKEITEIAKKCNNVKYTTNFGHHNATYPPTWCQTRWGGIYVMISSFLKQKQFFEQLAEQFAELDLSSHWEFIESYAEAFKPVYICSKNLQGSHVSLSDFYIAWLIAIGEVRRFHKNPLAMKLYETLQSRLSKLRLSQAFRMALYLDPRLNFVNSAIFNGKEKELIQGFITETWNHICRLNNTDDNAASSTTTSSSSDAMDANDGYITELFGGSIAAEIDTNQSAFKLQLKALDIEPRQKHNFDVWKHWIKRKSSHPELYAVANVVFATPSSQVSVERAFSALALVLSNQRTCLKEETLANIMIIKLNKDAFDQILPILYKWKDVATSVATEPL